MSQYQPRVEFLSYYPSFKSIIGDNSSARILAESKDGIPIFHEACIYHPPTKSVFVTSNQIRSHSAVAQEYGAGKHVRLTQIFVDDDAETQPTSTEQGHDDPQDEFRSRTKTIISDELTPDHSLAMAFLNGGVNYTNDTFIFCAQGSLNSNHHSGLVQFSPSDPQAPPKSLLPSFHSIPFNSVNDVIVHPKDGSIWFTDPCYGHYQGIRPPPQLPNQVYRFQPANQPIDLGSKPSIRAVADGFTRPNGLCFSPDLKTLYVTDTGAIHGSSDVPIDPTGPSHIYALDITENHFLTNRRLFAYAPGRYPDGIKCDTKGNVYAGCGDGINVWNKDGVFIGLIRIVDESDGGCCGVANFCFGENGTLYLCNEIRFWEVKLGGEGVKGALLGL